MKATYFHLAMALVTISFSLLSPRIKSGARWSGRRRGNMTDMNAEACIALPHPELQGCEDVHVYDSGSQRRLLTICSNNFPTDHNEWFPGLGHLNRSHHVRDTIYAIDPQTMQITPLELANYPADAEFVGHGFDVVRASGDASTAVIYAINHKRTGSVIEEFRYRLGSGSAEWVRTYDDQLMVHHPNDVFAPEDGRFYVTNDHTQSQGILRLLEGVLQLPTSKIAYWNGTGYSTAQTHITSANGITGQKAGFGDLVVINEVFPARQSVLERQTDGALKWLGFVELEFAPDNVIWVPETNEVVATGFPKLQSLLPRLSDVSAKIEAPVLAARWSLDRLNLAEFYGDGQMTRRQLLKTIVPEEFIVLAAENPLMQVATTALVDPKSDSVFFSSVFEPRMIRCSGYSTMATQPAAEFVSQT